jgi:hypothetical protein
LNLLGFGFGSKFGESEAHAKSGPEIRVVGDVQALPTFGEQKISDRCPFLQKEHPGLGLRSWGVKNKLNKI